MGVKNFAIPIVFLGLVLVLPMHGSGGRTGPRNLWLESGSFELKEFPQLSECTVRVYDHEVEMSLFPEMKHAVIVCLIRKGFHLHLSNGDFRRNAMCTECLELVVNWHHVQRRYLATQSPSPAPTFSLAVDRSAPAASPTPEGEPQTPSPALSRSPVQLPVSSTSGRHGPTVSQISAPKSSKPTHLKSTPNSPPSHEQEDPTKLILVAVVLSSIGTSLLFLCIFCCYRKFCRRRDSAKRRDDKPLLHLRLSNASGSSYTSFGPVGSNNHTDKPAGLQHNSGFSQNCHDFTGDVKPGGAASPDIVSNAPFLELNDGSEPKILLPLPPGRSPLPSAAPPTPLPVVPGPMSADVPSPPPVVAPLPPVVAPPAPPPPPPVKPPIKKVAPPPPPAPQPPLRNQKPGAQMPPPPPKVALPPRQFQGNSRTKKPSNLTPSPHEHVNADGDDDGPKTKLKPFFWDKVQANSRSNVWSHIKAGSFQFDEEMIESLFGYTNAADKNSIEKKKESKDASPRFIQLLEPKKSQNLSISLKALSVKSNEAREALMEGNELPTALLQSLLRMQPTTDEELKLRLYAGDLSLLAPAEQFLKDLIDIPYAYKRMDALLFMSSLHEDVTIIKAAFATMEATCTQLRNSRLFLKLLEAVLKTGNRMNVGTYRGGAQAFKLDTLLKLADVKGTDGKTTLLHFVVKQTIRSEGRRSARLAKESGSMTSLDNYSFNSNDLSEVIPGEAEDNLHAEGLKIVSGLSCELENVKKAAGIDIDAFTTTVVNFGRKLIDTKEFLNKDMKSLDEDSGFHLSLKCFVEHAEAAITFLLQEERRIRTLVQSTTDYFHGSATKDEGLRLFITVRDFLGMVDKICKEVKESPKRVAKPSKIRDGPPAAPATEPRRRLFPAIRDQRVESSSSDEEDD
ncbi:hypothetical protein ZIOFF_040311 [Zingiber officinale]|uniref:Formin-like protein n=1 Tax=Zingiber officinale TaxID=94328 RepID=A0A8J5G5Z7_ZINOF|nr:hypothetical protein ZIOFF_040311 [Zingiber officinale]